MMMEWREKKLVGDDVLKQIDEQVISHRPSIEQLGQPATADEYIYSY